MDYEEFFQRAAIAALPEAARHCRSRGKAAIAQHAKEQAKELCSELGLEPSVQPTTIKLGRPRGRTGRK